MARQSRLEQVQDDFLAALYGKEQAAVYEMAVRYRQAVKGLQPLWTKAYAMLQDAKAKQKAGVPGYDDDYISGFIWHERRLAMLMQQASELFMGMAKDNGLILTRGQQEALNLARNGAASQMMTGLGPVPVGAHVQAGFVQFPEQQMQMLVGRLSDGSPITEIANRYGTDGPLIIKQELIKGLANGEIPTQVARRMAKALGADFGRLAVMTRTEMLRVYRDTTQQVYHANSRLVRGWQWNSALQDTTCAMCWALHGRQFPTSEKMATHPCCRCSMTPVMRPWSEIHPGLSNVATVPLVPQGDQLFKRLPPSRQRRILGPVGHEAYKEGYLDIRDLVKDTWHDKWGAGRSQRSLRSVLGPDGYAKYRAKAYVKKKGPGGGAGSGPVVTIPKPPLAPPKLAPPRPIPKPVPAPIPKAIASPAPVPKPKPVPKVAPAPSPVPVSAKEPSPQGPAVSGYLTGGLPKSGQHVELGNSYREAVKEIDHIHGDGGMTPVPVKLNASRDAHGSYSGVYVTTRHPDGTFTRKIEPDSMKFSSATGNKHPRNTAAHEIGHYVDQQLVAKKLGIEGSKNAMASEDVSHPAMANWHKAISNSRAIKGLEDLQERARRGETYPQGLRLDGTPYLQRYDGAHLEYLLRKREIFARSYAQYVGNKAIKRNLAEGSTEALGHSAKWHMEIANQRDPTRGVYHNIQWADDDFEPIEQAFDELFAFLGVRG